MAFSPITSWQIDGETMETVTDFIFLGSKITADGYCSHEIWHLLLRRKVMTKLDSVLKSRDITLLTQVCLVKAMVFPVVMYGFESWTIKKDEHQRSVKQSLCFWAVVLEKTLESRLDSKIKPIIPKGSRSWIFTRRADAEAPILWPPDAKNWLIWKDPEAGKHWRQKKDERWDGWMASLTQWTWVWVNSRSWWWTGKPGVLQSMGSQRIRHDWVTSLIHFSKLRVADLRKMQMRLSSVQWLRHVWLFVTPWTAACQASLSITNSLSLLRLMSIESVMPSNHPILEC